MKLLYKLTVFLAGLLILNFISSSLLFSRYSKYGGNISVFIILELTLNITVLVLFAVVLHKTAIKPIIRLKKQVGEYPGKLTVTRSGEKDEIGELQNSIADLALLLDEEKKKQNRIIASISHDVKTPLTSVIGYSQLLKNPSLTEERRQKYLNIILEKSHLIESIISEFDDYLSSEMSTSLKPAICDVRGMCENFKTALKDEFASDKIEINVHCTANGSIYVDEKKLYRVFENAVANTLRHGDTEGLKTDIVVTKDKDGFTFAITDNGKGVGKNELGYVFEPMYTTDKSRSVAGLGLAICKEIIEAHEGQINAESEKGRYFSLVFKLPSAEINGEQNDAKTKKNS